MVNNPLLDSFPAEDELVRIIMNTSATVWASELLIKDIESWLRNFIGSVLNVADERRLALWFLCHFTFYNQGEVNHLCRVVHRDLIHSVVQGMDASDDPDKLVSEFFRKSNIISAEKTSGSGGFIAYLYRHENKLPMTLFNYSLDNIDYNIQNVIVIDDVTLTAGVNGQMNDFWIDAIRRFPTKSLYLLTLISSPQSKTYLKATFGVNVISAIELDDRDKCFHPESSLFASYRSKPEYENILRIGREFADHYGRKINIPGLHPLGYEDGQYTFGFYYNTPDNCLPIFWGQINGWVPIVRRYHKNYSSKVFFQDERFI